MISVILKCEQIVHLRIDKIRCVFVKVLQRNRTNKMCVSLYLSTYLPTLFKKSAHTIIEAWKGRLPCWRPREEL